MQKRVLYFDTDSAIYIQRPSDPRLYPPLGIFLGDFKNELDRNDHIVEFCSGGPKNYGCKVRGFYLNVEGSAQLNYNVLCSNTLEELFDSLAHPRITHVNQSHTIHRNPKAYTPDTRTAHKDYKMVYSKRVLVPGTARTYPYGYRQSEEESESDDVNLNNVDHLMGLLD